MNWKKGIAIVLSAVAVVAGVVGCGSDTGASSNGKYKIGVVQLVEHPALDAANKGFVDALAAKKLKEKVIIDQQNAQADQSNLNSIAQRFVSDKKDLILAIATPAAQTMANATKDIPILGTAITDYESSKLVHSNSKPGGNVSGTSDLNPIEKQVDLILKIVPNAKVIGTIYSASEVNSQIQVDKMRAYAESKGVKVVQVTVSNVNDIQQAAQNLVAQQVDAIYVPTDNVVASAMGDLVAITDAVKMPVFGSEDNQVKGGALATYSVDYYQLGYQTGLMAARILSGEEKISNMPVEVQKEFKLVVNKEKLKVLQITLPSDLEKEAQMI